MFRFYLSHDIHVALELGMKLDKVMKGQIGVLVFCLPPKTSLKKKYLVGEEWELITKKSRLCTDEPPEFKQIRGYDLVYGDMVANPKAVENGEKPLTHSIPKKQLASKSAKADVYLSKHLSGCLLFGAL